MGQKLKFVVSDLHLGAGQLNVNEYYPENFRADAEFVNFLGMIILESERDQREVELIINGDFLDFLRLPATDTYDPLATYPKEAFLDSSQTASVKRLNLIYQDHKAVFEALTRFMRAETPKRRLTIIKGSHDVHFFWPQVKSRLRELLRASGTRASLLLFAEEFVSREKIYVEHGHQQADQINRYADFRDPIQPDDPNQIDYPLGAQLAIEVHHQAGHQFPFAGTITPIMSLVWLALQWNQPLAARLLARIAQHTPSPVFDGATPDELWPRLQDDATCYQALQQSLEDSRLRQQLLGRIEHQLYFLWAGTPPPPEKFSFSLADEPPLSLFKKAQQQNQTSLWQAAERIASQEGAKAVLFGYCHQPDQRKLSNGGLYINTGCWIDTVSPDSLESWPSLFEQPPLYGKLPPTLPYARIDYDEAHNPVAQLLDFRAQRRPAIASGRRLPGKVMDWLSKWRQDRLKA